MKRALLLILVFIGVTLNAHATPKAGYVWNSLGDGLEYARISFASGDAGDQRITILHTFRVDPKKWRVDLLTPAPKETIGEWIDQMAKREGALIAVNGGFFTPEHNSIGLLVKSGKKLSPLHGTSWWSVFVIQDGVPAILPPWKAKNATGFSMAVQAGPRLVVDGRVPELKQSKSAARTALGITKDDKIIMVATEGAGITMATLAERLSATRFNGGLECPNAMGLDGGSSTQLYAKMGKLDLSIRGFSTVTNGVGIFKK